MILDIRSIYTKYLDYIIKTEKDCDKIQICTLKLKQKLHISNEKKEQKVFFLQQETLKVKRYKKMIDVIQKLASVKPDKFLSSIKTPIDQLGLVFIHTLLSSVNKQPLKKSPRHTNNLHTKSGNGSFRSWKLTKALPDSLTFTIGKNLSINQ